MTAKEYLKENGINVNMSEEQALDMLIKSHRNQKAIINDLRDRNKIDLEVFNKFYEVGKILEISKQ